VHDLSLVHAYFSPLTTYRQMGSLFPEPVKVPPLYMKLREWVDGLVVGALAIVQGFVYLNNDSALHLQAAIIACLVIGRFMPPCRVYILRTMVHPSKVSRGKT
jgi:hypothetical protein